MRLSTWMSSLLTASRKYLSVKLTYIFGKYGATHAYHDGLVRTIIY